MSEIILCNRNFSASAFKNACGIEVDQASSITCPNPNMIIANKPYLLQNARSTMGATTLAKLSNPTTTKNLTDLSLSLSLSLSFGGDIMIGLSTISAKLKEYNVALIGASTSIYANRMGDFVGAVKDYQAALMDYRQTAITKSPTKVAAKQKAKIAFDKMQNSFQHELKVVTSQVKSSRGTPLTNFERGGKCCAK